MVAVRAEQSFDDAAVWSRFDDGSELFVYAVPARSDHAEPEVRGERLVVGVVVQSAFYPSIGVVRDRFRCDELTVNVEGEAPPSFETIDEFLGGLIGALGCEP
jgi:hypothetical protein